MGKQAIPYFAVRVGERIVTSFRYPTGKPGAGDNFPARGEIRLASNAIAVLGPKGATPYRWARDPAAPESVARQLGREAKVVSVGAPP